MSTGVSPFSDLLEFLASTLLFQDLSKTQLAAVAQLARQQSFAKKETIFHQGDEGNGFYVIQTGRVKVFKFSAKGREQILHIFGASDHFAEVPALDGQPFPASAEAIDPVELLFFPRQLFLALLEQEPALAISMLKSVTRHLRRFSQLVDNLSLREVPSRLATYLLKLSTQNEGAKRVTLTLNKRQLAATLGTIPETLSRVFYRLSQDGIIAVEANQITLLDIPRLRDMAQ